MYHVVVINKETGEAVDARQFEYGTWAEIGFYLDHYGYNDPRFELKIRFSR